jgi:hypothetical protein
MTALAGGGFTSTGLADLYLNSIFENGSYGFIPSMNSSFEILPSPSRSILLTNAQISSSVAFFRYAVKNRSKFF